MAYINALEHIGVEIVSGNFDSPDKYCHREGRFCPIREEKQTDVGLAVEVLGDCLSGRTERAVLVTADSDHIPLVRKIKALRPKFVVYLVAPPSGFPKPASLAIFATVLPN